MSWTDITLILHVTVLIGIALINFLIRQSHSNVNDRLANLERLLEELTNLLNETGQTPPAP